MPITLWLCQLLALLALWGAPWVVATVSADAARTPTASATSPHLPSAILKLLPPAFEVMAAQASDLTGDGLPDHVVVLKRRDEQDVLNRGKPAPERPLLVFVQQPQGHFVETARNDQVVARADEGQLCDPFMAWGQGLSLKGPYFTVENGEACGAHWTDYVTYRYVPASKRFVFHKRITEYWRMNPDGAGEALVRVHSKVEKADPSRLIDLSEHRLPR